MTLARPHPSDVVAALAPPVLLSPALWRAVADALPIAVLVLDADLVPPGPFIRYANPAAGALLGRDPDEMVGRPPSAVSGSPDRYGHDPIRKGVTEGRPATSHVHVRRADGTVHEVLIDMQPLRLDGRVEAFLVVQRDLTSDLIEELSLRSVVEHSWDIVSVVAPDGAVRYVSPSIERVLGWTPAELSGTWVFDHIHDDDRVAGQQRLSEAVTGTALGSSIEYRFQAKDGSWRWLESVPVNLLDDPLVGGVAFTTRDVTARHALEDRLAHRASHDLLTGLLNREGMVARLEIELDGCTAERHDAALLYVDLDRVKLVNDAFGHAFGDEVIVAASRRLASLVPDGCPVARVGGDEFLVLLTDGGPARARAVASDIVSTFRQPMTVGARRLTVTVSVGLAGVGSLASAPESLRRADLALQHAKASGHDRVEVYDEALHTSARERLEIENDLRGAVARRELLVHAQPSYRLDAPESDGVELLVRWQHPERGLLMPGTFVPVAEATDLILPVGLWVLREACGIARTWIDAGIIDPARFTVWVNASARQVVRAEFADLVADAMAAHDVPVGALGIEVTESALMADPDETALQLRRLAGMGVRIALDDFGTGYSSLAYLARYPVDLIKIDRSFTSRLGEDPVSEAIVRTVVGLAHSLGALAIAEGVETEAQLAHVARLGCDRASGYFLARPQPIDDVAALLSGRARPGGHTSG